MEKISPHRLASLVPLRTACLYLPLLLLASACATLSETECRTIDWEQLGEDDGARGFPPERIEEHRSACAEYGITPDEDAWAKGRLAGLDRLCSINGGLAHGRSGRIYAGVCPAGFEEDFYEGYTLGRQIYLTRDELEEVERDIRQFELELQRYDREDDRLQNEYYRLSELERTREALERELVRLEAEARRMLAKI